MSCLARSPRAHRELEAEELLRRDRLGVLLRRPPPRDRTGGLLRVVGLAWLGKILLPLPARVDDEGAQLFVERRAEHTRAEAQELRPVGVESHVGNEPIGELLAREPSALGDLGDLLPGLLLQPLEPELLRDAGRAA